MKVEQHPCWGEFVLPLESQRLDFVNIGDAEGLADQDQLDFQLLSAKSHAAWTPQALGLPHVWWKIPEASPFFE